MCSKSNYLHVGFSLLIWSVFSKILRNIGAFPEVLDFNRSFLKLNQFVGN
jgi:hypothetical protein